MAVNPTGSMIRSSFASLMKSAPELRKIYFNEYDRLPDIYSKYMIVESSTKKTETENVLASLGEWSSHTEGEDYSFNELVQGTEVTATHTSYAQGYSVSQELIEDDQWNVINQGAKTMAAGGKSIVESVASTPFDNAFTSGTGSDGSYLCVTNHNLINSGSTGSNALTTPLSAEGLEAAYILGRNVVDDANVIIRTQYDTLLIPEDLERKAEELMMSVLNPETGNNAINVYKGKIKNIVVCPYLSSASAWFLIDSSSQRRPKFFWRLKPEFHVVTHPTSLNALMIARERFSTIFAGWQGVIGSTGAA